MSEETPNELREQLKALEKDLGKMRKDFDLVVKENRGLKARDAFAEINPELADLYVAVNPDADEITVDAAKEFAEKYGFAKADDAPPAPEGTEQTPPQPNTEGLNLINRAGSGAGQGGQQAPGDKSMTVSEWVAMSRKDKVAAEAALREGRVRVRDDNPMARDRINMGDENPFDSFNREAFQSKQS